MVMFSKLREAKNVIMIKIRLIVQSVFLSIQVNGIQCKQIRHFREVVLIQGFFYFVGGQYVF